MGLLDKLKAKAMDPEVQRKAKEFAKQQAEKRKVQQRHRSHSGHGGHGYYGDDHGDDDEVVGLADTDGDGEADAVVEEDGDVETFDGEDIGDVEDFGGDEE